VRKAGNQVRVTVQLIAAHSDTHLWSQTYDRPLDDIFAIEDQISAAVVEQLKVQLLGNVPKATATNPEAYALTLRARQQYQAGTPEGVVASVALFRQAIEIAPDYAPAWGALAVAYSFEAARALRPVAEAVPLARAAAQHALALAPDLAIAHAILGSIAHTYDRDLPAAAAHLERAMLLGPRNSDVLRFAAQVAQGLGRKAQALALAEANVRLDPANPHARTALGRIQRISGHLDDSIESFRRALAESPRLNALHHYLTIVLLLRHRDNADLEAAQREALAEPEGGYRTVAVALAEFALGHRAESDAALAIAVREHERDASYNIAYAYAYRHEADAAFTWLDKAVAYNDSGLNELATKALFAPIHADPRWRQLLERLKRTPEELAAIPFDVAVPTGLPSAGPQQ